ncbi:hypothetical protein BKG86_00775 [Mycobacteroides chelonae]|uniref:hypothetical protein n=1 Tax=Mycobacteroides chelonae TaxID=1774 RepID=UPI000911003B|nr:hypothetical protein [Mycobacteroides chelonae]OHU72373.1 hypothetical protein BKG86_00775 [Mycobacteroides chelonae]
MAVPKAAFLNDQLDDLDELLPALPKKNKRPAVAEGTAPAPGVPAASRDESGAEEAVEGPTSQEVPQKEAPPAPAEPAPKKPSRSKVATETSETTPGALTADISATNLQDLRDLIIREKARNLITARTQGQVVLDAVEAHEAELQEFWKNPAKPAGTGGLFKRQPVIRKRRRHAEPTGQITLTGITDEDGRLLDELWPEWGAPSRGAFVDQALTLYLPTTKRRTRRTTTETTQDEATED